MIKGKPAMKISLTQKQSKEKIRIAVSVLMF